MQLYLDSYGAFLGVENGMFWFKPKHSEGRAIACQRINCIFLTKGVRISSDAILLALSHNIPMVFTDQMGRSQGYLWSGQYGSISTVRKKQARFADHPLGMDWVRDQLLQRAKNQLTTLELLQEQPYARKDKQGQSDFVKDQKSLSKLIQRWEKLPISPRANLKELAASFRGWEGGASRTYFQAFARVLPEKWGFAGRMRRPAYDPFNALLNYLYGMLYPLVELSLIKAGLDPYMGVLHTDRYNRPTLVFDCIEIYRHWAEWTALQLVFEKGLDPQQHFEERSIREGIRLAPSGKKKVIAAMLGHLEERTIYQGQKRKRKTQIDLGLQSLASYLKTLDF
ncbi:CRISPR-associated endonuclease Cas1 [Saprospira grandis]|nr:CRISPR-associated endonuclease Cas1 [Saprospira grandis]